jgi:hypothetical protein
MSYFIKRAEEEEAEPAEEGTNNRVMIMSEEEEEAEADVGAEKLGQRLRSALKMTDVGIGIGIDKDLASKRNVSDTIFGGIQELIVAPLTLSTPGRSLERGIKGAGIGIQRNSKVNEEAKDRFKSRVVDVCIRLFNSNFQEFTRLIKENNLFSDLQPNDISNIEALAIEYRGSDPNMRTTSRESPYKIILNQLIPIMREKFDAVVSFREIIGAGENVDYESFGNMFFEGDQEDEDIKVLEAFYKAIIEWYAVAKTFSTGDVSPLDSGGEAEGEDSEAEGEDSEAIPFEQVAKDIYIQGVRPGQNASVDPTGDNRIIVNTRALSSGDTPVIKLFVKGTMAEKVNSVGSGEEYVNFFIKNRKLVIMDNKNLENKLLEVTRESVSGGAEITLYLNPQAVLAYKGRSSDRVEVMRVQAGRGEIEVVADDKDVLDALVKLSSTGETTPYYTVKSPSGESIHFTPADLVISGGKLKDSKGKRFKPRKARGKSLADRVMSPSFGRVKKRK